jgi:DNA-binding XRE family transcriptional regulator
MPAKKISESSVNKARRLPQRRAFSFVVNIRQAVTARFGTALKEKRQSLGMTQVELAKIAGLSRSYVSEVECGREGISLERAEKLAKAVDSRLSELLREE